MLNLNLLKPELNLDATGLQCPGPIMMLYHQMQGLQEGQTVRISATDPGFRRDVGAWAESTGNSLLSLEQEGGVITAVLSKGAPQPQAQEQSIATTKDKTMIIFSADLDRALAAFIIANGAASMGDEVTLFFTFWGLNVLRRPDAPALKKPFMDAMFGRMMPAGVGRLNSISKMNFAGMGAWLIRKVMRDKRVEEAAQLLKNLQEGGAQLIACQMSMDVMGIRHEELIDGVELGGVAAFLDEAHQSATTLFI